MNSEPDLPALDPQLLADLTAHPHDTFFKRVFSELPHAIALFRNHLPARIVAAISWKTMELQPTSFVKQELKQTHSDLLFAAEIAGAPCLLYLLFEHQTSVDDNMPLRLLGYLCEIWQRYRQQHPEGKLPVIIPFVLHQGPEKWRVPTQFHDHLALPEDLLEDLQGFVPQFQHALLDLTQSHPQTDEPEPAVSMALALMQQARLRQNLLTFFAWLNASHPTVAERYFRLLLLYAIHIEGSLSAVLT